VSFVDVVGKVGRVVFYSFFLYAFY